jgi:cytochrome P450
MAVRYDPLSETFRRDRAGEYRALRDEAPVYLDPDRRFAALSRFDDVRAAAADWKTFSAVTAESKILRPIINDMDPPRPEAGELVAGVHTKAHRNRRRQSGECAFCD